MFNSSASKKRQGTVQGRILDDILKNIDVFGDLFRLPPYAGPRYHFEARIAREQWEQIYGQDRKKKRALRELRKKKWIKDRKKGDEMVVLISSEAVVALFREKILSISETLPTGQIMILCFDFPVGATKARDKWRHFIKRCGFSLEQQSVYSTRKNIGNEMKALAKVLGIERWVKLYKSIEL